jgi:CTP synthase (UTP-ammonia lyase)
MLQTAEEGAMAERVRIGIIGDFDGRPSHLATNEAIAHSAAALGLVTEAHWLPTPLLLRPEGEQALAHCDGLWASPGSPYQSMEGALAGIRFARERAWPFVGT